MAAHAVRLKQALIFVHRWIGVSLCLVFLTWFSSGVVMMYWDYPSVSPADRFSRASALDVFKIRLSPAQAYAQLHEGYPPDEVVLRTFDGRPVFLFSAGGGRGMVYADDGEVQGEFTPETALRVAAAWTGRPAGEATIGNITEADQWTVSEEFAELRPMRKYTWPDGEQVYVSTVTGAVVQYTTRASRMGAYFGAIPHWLYFTGLRKRAEQWTRIVIWASGLGTLAAALGIVVGVWTYSPRKRYRPAGAASSIPYVGQKRWHAILGLVFGVCACTWVFSGMLSMDPFPRLQEGNSDEIDARIEEGLRGDRPDLEAFAVKSPQEALTQLGPSFKTMQLEFSSFAGEPFYLATGADSQKRIVPVEGEPETDFSIERITAALRRAALPARLTQVRLITKYEAYYLDRHGRLPLPAIFVQLDDAQSSSYYVDPKTAQIVQGYNASSRRNRWLYHGLHSLNFPWLYSHRPAWDIVVLTLLGGGIALCVTSLLLAFQVMRRKLGQLARFR
jgi:PepSY-associated TM region